MNPAPPSRTHSSTDRADARASARRTARAQHVCVSVGCRGVGAQPPLATRIPDILIAGIHFLEREKKRECKKENPRG